MRIYTTVLGINSAPPPPQQLYPLSSSVCQSKMMNTGTETKL